MANDISLVTNTRENNDNVRNSNQKKCHLFSFLWIQSTQKTDIIPLNPSFHLIIMEWKFRLFLIDWTGNTWIDKSEKLAHPQSRGSL